MNEDDKYTRCGTIITVTNNDHILEDSTIFTMSAKDDTVSIMLQMGYNTAKQESDISNGRMLISSKIIDDIDKPGISFKVEDNSVIHFDLINMTPEYFNNIEVKDNPTYIFTTRKHIANYNTNIAVIAEFIIHLIGDVNTTLVIALNIYTKNNPST